MKWERWEGGRKERGSEVGGERGERERGREGGRERGKRE